MITGIYFVAENSTFSFENLNSFYMRYEKANFGSVFNWINFLEEILMEFTNFFSQVNFVNNISLKFNEFSFTINF